MNGCQYGFMTSGMFQVAGTHQVQDLVTGQVPEILVENLHLDGAGVASGLNGSAQATQFLQSIGYRKVKNLTGGIDRWAREVDPSVPKY